MNLQLRQKTELSSNISGEVERFASQTVNEEFLENLCWFEVELRTFRQKRAMRREYALRMICPKNQWEKGNLSLE